MVDAHRPTPIEGWKIPRQAIQASRRTSLRRSQRSTRRSSTSSRRSPVVKAMSGGRVTSDGWLHQRRHHRRGADGRGQPDHPQPRLLDRAQRDQPVGNKQFDARGRQVVQLPLPSRRATTATDTVLDSPYPASNAIDGNDATPWHHNIGTGPRYGQYRGGPDDHVWRIVIRRSGAEIDAGSCLGNGDVMPVDQSQVGAGGDKGIARSLRPRPAGAAAGDHDPVGRGALRSGTVGPMGPDPVADARCRRLRHGSLAVTSRDTTTGPDGLGVELRLMRTSASNADHTIRPRRSTPSPSPHSNATGSGAGGSSIPSGPALCPAVTRRRHRGDLGRRAGAARWDVAHWDEAVWSAAGWRDVTPESVDVEILWGSQRPELGILSSPRRAAGPSTSTTLTGSLDPANAEGPYYGDLEPGLPVRLRHGELVVKQGIAESIGYQFSEE